MAKVSFDYKDIVFSDREYTWTGPDKMFKIEIDNIDSYKVLHDIVIQIETVVGPRVYHISSLHIGGQKDKVYDTANLGDGNNLTINIALLSVRRSKVGGYEAHIRFWGSYEFN